MSRDSLVLVALSGGADSVALLHVLLELRARRGFAVAAAHLNHQIRGDESDRDEAFVRELCRRLGIELVRERAAGLDGTMPNLEESAREVRRDFLERAAEKADADFIALAHHRDDQAETVMMRLLRGAGAAGLKGMAEAGPGRIIRPMLTLARDEIRAFIQERGIDFVEDSSNASRTILRNRIRHELLPHIEHDYAGGFAGRLAALAKEMRESDDLISMLAAKTLVDISVASDALDASRFRGLHPALQLAVVRMFIERVTGSLRRVTREHIEAIRFLAVDAGPSAATPLPGRWRARREYDLLKLERYEVDGSSVSFGSHGFSIKVNLDGDTRLDDVGFIFNCRIQSADAAAMPTSLYEAIFDAAGVIPHGLIARGFRAGDRVAPLGFEGHRKVKEIFIDRKLPRERRARWPLVTLNDQILWIPGIVRSRAALVTGQTETVLRIDARQHSDD